MAKNIEVDPHGNIWVQHMRKGLYRVRLDEALKQVTDLKQYDSLSGNPGGHCYLFKVNGRVAFSDGRNFYTYDDMADSIIPYKAMNEQLAALRDIHTVTAMKGDLYWFLSDREACLVRCTVNDFKVERRIPFSMFGNLPIEGWPGWYTTSGMIALTSASITPLPVSLPTAPGCTSPVSNRLYGSPAFRHSTSRRASGCNFRFREMMR